MSTNNRNVGLQQHVVLLTVMERAEDLIKNLNPTILYTLCRNKYAKELAHEEDEL